jgi:hypothetical protein
MADGRDRVITGGLGDMQVWSYVLFEPFNPNSRLRARLWYRVL